MRNEDSFFTEEKTKINNILMSNKVTDKNRQQIDLFFLNMLQEANYIAIFSDFISDCFLEVDQETVQKVWDRLSYNLIRLIKTDKETGSLLLHHILANYAEAKLGCFEQLINVIIYDYETYKEFHNMLCKEIQTIFNLQWYLEEQYQNHIFSSEDLNKLGYSSIVNNTTLYEEVLEEKVLLDITKNILKIIRSNLLHEEAVTFAMILNNSVKNLILDQNVKFIFEQLSLESPKILLFNKGVEECYGSYNSEIENPIINLFNGNMVIKPQTGLGLHQFMNTFAHESLHFLIDKCFRNDSNPYKRDDFTKEEEVNQLSKLVINKLQNDLNVDQDFFEKSMYEKFKILKDIVGQPWKSEYALLTYSAEALNSEIWAFYIGEKVQRLNAISDGMGVPLENKNSILSFEPLTEQINKLFDSLHQFFNASHLQEETSTLETMMEVTGSQHISDNLNHYEL